MNTLAALMSKLESGTISRESRAVCELIDAHIANQTARLEAIDDQLMTIRAKLRGDEA